MCRMGICDLKGKGKVKVAQSCPTLCDSMDYIVHGIPQARILEWVAFPFSRRSSQPRDRTQVSHIAGGFFTNCAIKEALLWFECGLIITWSNIISAITGINALGWKRNLHSCGYRTIYLKQNLFFKFTRTKKGKGTEPTMVGREEPTIFDKYRDWWVWLHTNLTTSEVKKNLDSESHLGTREEKNSHFFLRALTWSFDNSENSKPGRWWGHLALTKL